MNKTAKSFNFSHAGNKSEVVNERSSTRINVNSVSEAKVNNINFTPGTIATPTPN